MAIGSDGGIVVAGYDESANGDLVDLVRFLPDGTLDPNFGSDGKLDSADQPAGAAYSVAIQANNLIVVGGAFTEDSRMDFGLARFFVDGSIDSSFGTNGIATQDLGGGNNSAVTALAIQPNGDILAAGVTGNLPGSGPTGAALERFFAGQTDGAVVRVVYGSPALPTSGADDTSSGSSVAANDSYTLTLGDSWTDLGSGPGISYDIYWGDGSPDTTITADNLAAQGDQVTHVFTSASGEITVNLDVDGNIYSNVGVQPLSVDTTDATTTSLEVSSTSPSVGDSITLAAIVAAAVSETGVPSGTVEFYDGTIDLGPGALSWNIVQNAEMATLNTPPLTLGDHGFTAVYSGDGTFDPSTSSTVVASVTSALPGYLNLTGTTLATGAPSEESLEYQLNLPTTVGGNTITQWSINWGDGTAATTFSGDPSTQTHEYVSAGDYLIQATATANGNPYSAVLNNDMLSTLDNSFGTSGTVTGTAGSVSSLAVQPDGSIVAVESGTGLQPVSSLVRLTSSGQPDGTTFDDVSSQIPNIAAVVIQPDCSPLSSGEGQASSSPLPLGEGQGVRAFDIVVAGLGVDGDYTVARYSSDGTLDTTFGAGGTTSLGPSGATTWANPPSKLLVQPDGDIVVVGIEPDSNDTGADDLVLARFTPNGQTDGSFGTDGIVAYDLGGYASSCDAVVQTGNQIVAAVGLVSPDETEVMRFTYGGLLDNSSNDSQGAQGAFASGNGMFYTTSVTANPLLAAEPDGRIVLAGDNGSSLVIMRYLADGSGLDSTFNTDTLPSTQVQALAIQPGGRIIALDSVMGGTNSWSLNAFTESGLPDTAFMGAGGKIATGLSGTSAAMAIQPDGKVVVAGTSGTDAYFARYTSGGLDVPVASVAPSGLTATLNEQAGGPAVTGYSSGDDVSLNGSFTNPGNEEVCTVSIDWGDGSPVTTFSLDPGATSFQYPAEQYAASGTYTIKVTVGDAAGNSNTFDIRVYYSNVRLDAQPEPRPIGDQSGRPGESERKLHGSAIQHRAHRDYQLGRRGRLARRDDAERARRPNDLPGRSADLQHGRQLHDNRNRFRRRRQHDGNDQRDGQSSFAAG